MKPRQVIAELALLGSQDLRVTLHFLADRAIASRLENGQRLCDVIDFTAWLRELAAATQISDSTEVQREPVSRPPTKVTYPCTGSRFNLDFCPACGHIHVEEKECGFPIGGDRVCRCERAVPA